MWVNRPDPERKPRPTTQSVGLCIHLITSSRSSRTSSLIFQMAPVVPAAASSSSSSSSSLRKKSEKVAFKAKDKKKSAFSLDEVMNNISNLQRPKNAPRPPPPAIDLEKDKAYDDGRDYKVDNGHMYFFRRYPKYFQDPLGLCTVIPNEVCRHLLKE